LLTEPILDDNADWKKRFRMPRVLIQFARRNPTRTLVISNQSGIYQLYGFNIGTNSLKQATNRRAGTIYGSISPDGRHLYYMNDKQGNETGHIVRVPFEGGPPQDLTPEMSDYTLVSPEVDDTSAHLGLTVPGPEGFDSYVVEIGGLVPGNPLRINRSKKTAEGPIFSHDGNISVVASTDRFGGLDYSLISFETKSGHRLNEIADEQSRIEPAEFSPTSGDQRLLAMSNISGTMRPMIWNATNGTRTDLPIGKLEGDVIGLTWTEDAKSVLLCQTNKATTQLWQFNLQTSVLTKVSHPEGTVAAACFHGDEVLLSWQDSTHPPQILAVQLVNPATPPSGFLTPREVPKSRSWLRGVFKSSDGEEIQFWYATPGGKGPFPTILETHGGPTAAMFNVFSPRSQIWLDHGFAFASINYRGSTTFGKDFEKKINGDIGHWEVEDMVAGRRWLVDNGIAIPDKVFLTGWSYGGYLTLQAMGVHPELWAGGMGGVVVADWVTEYYDEPDAMKGYDVALHGGTPDDKPEEYRKSSPINYLGNLKAPLLIIQGRNDVRDPPRQVELYEAKAKALGKDVEVVWFDTGHAGSGVDVTLAISHHETMLRWIYRVLNS
jgi:dipeptidyl aminopeptidase/acylaminoacyl peptidase